MCVCHICRASARDITGKELPSEYDAFIRSSLCYIGLLVEIGDLEIYLAKPVKTEQSVLAYLVQLATLRGNKGVSAFSSFCSAAPRRPCPVYLGSLHLQARGLSNAFTVQKCC